MGEGGAAGGHKGRVTLSVIDGHIIIAKLTDEGSPRLPLCPLRVTSVALCDRWLPSEFRYALFATEVMRRCKMTQRATNGHDLDHARKGAVLGGRSAIVSAPAARAEITPLAGLDALASTALTKA